MNPNNVWKKNREFYIGVAGTVLEGLFSEIGRASCRERV